MTALVRSGFESQKLSASAATCGEGQGIATVGTVTIDTTHQASGAACASCGPSASNNISVEIATTLGRTYFFRQAVWFSSVAPSTNLDFMEISSTLGKTIIEVYLGKTGEEIRVWDEITASNIIESGFKPTKETWYYFELKIDVPVAGNGVVGLVIRDATGKALYESGDKSVSIGTTLISKFLGGHISSGETAITVKIDDWAINDSQGEKQKSYPGYGKIVHLKPISDKERTGWTNGAGGTTNLWEAVNHTPPTGVKASSSTATTQIKDSTNNSTDTYLANTASYEKPVAEGGGGVGASDSIKLAAVIGRCGNSSTTSRNVGISATSNPEITEVLKATGTTLAEAEVTGWGTGITEFVYEPAVTLSSGSIVKVRKGTASTDAASVDMINLLVEYVPNTTKNLAASMTITDSFAAPLTRIALIKAAMTITNTFVKTLTRIATLKSSLTLTNTFIAPLLIVRQIKAAMVTTNTFAGKLTLVKKLQAALSTTITWAANLLTTTSEKFGVAVRAETIPDKLACRINLPGNVSPARWAEDEARVENVMSGIVLSDEMPGGYKQAEAVLARDPRLSWSDLEGFGNISFYLPGVEEVWDGRLEKAPDETGDNISIRPEGAGWQAALDDNKAVQIGIIDSDISKWGDGPLSRKQAILEGTASVAGPNLLCVEASVNSGENGLPGLIFTLGNVVAGRTPIGELWYYGDGIDIGEAIFDGVVMPTSFGGDANMLNAISTMKDDLSTGYKALFEAHQTNVTDYGVLTGGSGYKYLGALMAYLASLPTNEYKNSYSFQNIKVMGRHGLAVQGTWPEVGFTAKQCIEYIIKTFAQSLKIDPSLIEDDGFIIPQAWYGSAAPPSAAIKDLIKYSLWDWFVYKERKFQLRKPGSYGRFWKVYLSEANIDDTGLDTSRLWDSIVVQYQEPSGQTRTVGPLGSGAHTESELLEIKDPENPAFKAVSTRRDLLVMQVGTPAGAIRIGQRFLEESVLLPRSGSARISGYALDNKGVLRPVSQIHSGDYVSFVDHSDKSYRKIVNKTYNHDNREASIDFDAPPGGLEQLLERLQVVLVRQGVS